jgi:hypothetical protein
MEAAGLTECALNGVPSRTNQQHPLLPHLPVLSDRFTRAYPLISAHSVTCVSLKDADSASLIAALSVKAMKETYLCTGPNQCPSGIRRGSEVARLLSLRFRNPPKAQKDISCECCVLSGTSLCVRLITRPEDSYRV